LRDWLLDAGFTAVDFFDAEGEPSPPTATG
jgi:hypothetical protein